MPDTLREGSEIIVDGAPQPVANEGGDVRDFARYDSGQDNQTIPHDEFTRIELDRDDGHGMGWDTSNYEFVAPEPGIYLFDLQLQTVPTTPFAGGEEIVVRLESNDMTGTQPWDEDANSGRNTWRCTDTPKFDVGDTMWIEVRQRGGDSVDLELNPKYTRLKITQLRKL